MSKSKGVPNLEALGDELSYRDGRAILELVEKEVEDTLTQRGIVLREKWDLTTDGEIFSGEVPEDLTSWDTKELGGYLARLGNYVGFLNNVASYYKSRASAWDSLLTFTHAYYSKVHRKSGLSDAEIKEAVLTDPRYVTILSKYQEAKMLTIRLEAAHKEQNKNYNSVSRIITLRQENEGRNRGRFNR